MLTNRKKTIVRSSLISIVLFLTFVSIKASTRFDIPGPAGSGYFGWTVKTLPNGNFVVVDRARAVATGGTGGIYLFNGATRQLISTLTSDGGSYVVTVLPGGNYVVQSPNWNGYYGAVTFCHQVAGCDGTVSSANSLVGSTAYDYVGLFDLTILANGNYVVNSMNWNVNRGAVTFGSGSSGVSGVVSAANSLVGVTSGEQFGHGPRPNGAGIFPLANGNYVVTNERWSQNRGSATFCSGSTGCIGTVSTSNSLVGSNSDFVGTRGIVELTNSNYIVVSSNWKNGSITGAGALTWGSSTLGVTGLVSPSNSLVGTTQNGQLGNSSSAVTPLKNGNYVVLVGKLATFCDGTTGRTGLQSPENSLVTNNAFLSSVTALTNGNYVVSFPRWDFGSFPNAGAVTLGNGVTGTVGIVSPSNSFVGNSTNRSIGDGGVVPLINGNYVIVSQNGSAASFGSGSTGLTGTISSSNSLIGNSAAGGEFKVTPLQNGNYVVSNSNWSSGVNGSLGSVTLGSGDFGVSGTVSASNSLVGSQSGDEVGTKGILSLSTGNFVVLSPNWNGFRGASTFVNGTNGLTGEISSENSIVGIDVNGNHDTGAFAYALANGNYVVTSSHWNGARGAATLGDGQNGVSGPISAANSLVGGNPGDRVAWGNNTIGVVPLPNGDFVVSSSNWNGDRGAVTYVNGSTGLNGIVSSQNSLVGVTPVDSVGSGYWDPTPPKAGIVPYNNGIYLIYSPQFDNGAIANAGAVSVASAGNSLFGEIDSNNSVVDTASEGGIIIDSAYDPVNGQFIVGRPGSNTVTVVKLDQPPVPVSISGRVLTSDGRGLRSASVAMTDLHSVRRVVTTNSFGYFSFDGVLTGGPYTVSVSTKRYRFSSRTLQVTGGLTLDDFIGVE